MYLVMLNTVVHVYTIYIYMYENVCLIWIQHLTCVTPHVFYTRTNALC